MFHALSVSLFAVGAIHSAQKFSTVSCVRADEHFVECISDVCLRYASVISLGKRYFSSVRLWLGPDATMSRFSAVNGNFMTSLTLITFIKLSCRTHVVECTFMCLLGNLDLLQCLSVARPALSSPSGRYMSAGIRCISLDGHLVRTMYCRTAIVVISRNYWPKVPVDRIRCNFKLKLWAAESLLSHFRSKWFSNYSQNDSNDFVECEDDGNMTSSHHWEMIFSSRRTLSNYNNRNAESSLNQ